MRKLLFLFAFPLLMSLSTDNETLVPFAYPQRNNTAITMWFKNFNPFKAEWRGSDYLYKSISYDSINCTVLYYKLNSQEQYRYEELYEGLINENSNVTSKNINTNSSRMSVKNIAETDEFTFKQKNIYKINGIPTSQKHMYAISELDRDLFLIIHLYKTYYSSNDSIQMSQIIHSIKRVK